jgi:broad specificity phosphatase PhoE
MPAILLIRHGQASYGAADYDVLSPTGERQAQAVLNALRGYGDGRLVSGSMRRQLDTAAPWHRDITVDARWNEYDAADVLGAHSPAAASLEHPVDAEGEPLSSRDFQTLLDGALHAWIAAGANGGARETWAAFRERTLGALHDLMASLGSGQTGLAFTSGGVIAALAAVTLGLPDSAMVAFNHVTVNGGVTKLVGGRRGISLISFNEHAHLQDDDLVTYR